MDPNLTKSTEEQIRKLRRNYEKYQTEMSARDQNLYEKAADFEAEYFEDFIFNPGSICYDIYELIEERFTEPFFELDSNYFRFYVVDALDNASGVMDGNERTISIIESHKDNKSTILHEMIHAYEQIMDDSVFPIVREILLIRLYNKLNPLIENLDTMINRHADLSGQFEVQCHGGQHDLLFYLKSLDLDIRCGFPLGTVCAYGRDTGEMWY